MKGPLSWLDKWLTDWENRWFCCALLTFFFCLFFFVFPEISAYICFTSLDLYSFRHFPWSRHCLLCLEVMDHFYLFSLSSQELNHRNLYTISDQQSLISTQQIFFFFFLLKCSAAYPRALTLFVKEIWGQVESCLCCSSFWAMLRSQATHQCNKVYANLNVDVHRLQSLELTCVFSDLLSHLSFSAEVIKSLIHIRNTPASVVLLHTATELTDCTFLH